MPRYASAWTLLLTIGLATSAAAQTSSDLADTLAAQATARGALPWSARHPVVWPDFRGRPHQGGSTAAQTSSGVSYMIQCRDSHLSFAVLSVFVPAESWVRPDVPPSRTASLPTLRHERTHFDITEMFGRRLRQALASSRDICPHHTKEARRVFQRLKSDSDAMQSRYDEETAHGVSTDAQARWSRSVVAGLDSLKNFAAEAGRD